eukprot:gene10719-biopygen7745
MPGFIPAQVRAPRKQNTYVAFSTALRSNTIVVDLRLHRSPAELHRVRTESDGSKPSLHSVHRVTRYRRKSHRVPDIPTESHAHPRSPTESYGVTRSRTESHGDHTGTTRGPHG